MTDVVVEKELKEGTSSGNNEVAPPLDLMFFLKEQSGVDLFSLSPKDLPDRLRTGLILRDKENTETQFFWKDKESNLNCFMLLPKSLRISTDSGQVPRLVYEKEIRCTGQEITLPLVKYESVRLLKIEGKFVTTRLSWRGSEVYEVVLFLKPIPTRRNRWIYAASSASKLSLPDGSQKQQPGRPWFKIPDEKWLPFQVGEFKMNPDNIGELSFDLQVYFYNYPDILIKGVAIQSPSPKK